MSSQFSTWLFSSFLFLGAAPWLFFPSLSFCQPLFVSFAHRCVFCYSHQGHGIIPAILWLLGLLYQLKESSPVFVSSWWRLLLFWGLFGPGLWHTECCWVFKGHLLVLSGHQAVTSLLLLLFVWLWARQDKQNVQCVKRKFIPYLTALPCWWLPRIWLASFSWAFLWSQM